MNAITKCYLDAVLGELQACDEAGGPDGDEYIELMEAVAAEASRRAAACRERRAEARSIGAAMDTLARAGRRNAEARQLKAASDRALELVRRHGDIEATIASIETAQRYYARDATDAETGADKLPGLRAELAKLRAELGWK